MPNRHSCVIIVLFWTGMMAWYLQREVIPAWLRPSSPDYRSLVSPRAQSSPVRWLLYRDEELIGHAETRMVSADDGSVELRNTARFRQLPVPPWLAETGPSDHGMEARANFQLDPEMQLEEFRVTLEFEQADPIRVHGTVENQQLGVVFQAGSRRVELPPQYYPPHRLVGDVLSPLDRLPPLRAGQSWGMSIVNPLTRQVGVIRVEVAGNETIRWSGRRVPTSMIQYKGAGVHARAWVRRDGLVLKQEVSILWSTFTFVRVASMAQSTSASGLPRTSPSEPEP